MASKTKGTGQTWPYKGHTIEITEHATFFAIVDGTRYSGGSIDTLKKKLDSVNAFEPFDCYFDETGWSARTKEKGAVARFEGVEVGKHALIAGRAIGIEKDQFRRHSSPKWRVEYTDEKGKVCHTIEHAVLPANQDAIDTWLAYWQTYDESKIAEKALEEANNEKIGNLHAAVPWKRIEVE